MMSDQDIFIDYREVAEMSRIFGQSAKSIEALITELIGIASELENGVLLGEGGTVLAEGIRNQLVNKSLQSLKEFLLELQTDTNNVISIHRDGESVRSRFFS